MGRLAKWVKASWRSFDGKFSLAKRDVKNFPGRASRLFTPLDFQGQLVQW